MRSWLCAVVIISALCTGCGSTPAQLDAGALGLPQAPVPATLASTTIYTSPDGGIYKNPDVMDVVLAVRGDIGPIARQLGSTAAGWSALQRFGAFTLVALQLQDNGKVSSDPQLNDLQVASDYAPPGTETGPLRHFYHPTYPLAVVSATTPGGDCSVHLDPGHAVVVILVYPPVNLAKTMVWGAYGDFVLTVPTGGALPVLPGTLRAVTCAPPDTVAPTAAP